MKGEFLLVFLALAPVTHARHSVRPAVVSPAAPPSQAAANDALIRGDYPQAVALFSSLLAYPRFSTEDKAGLYVSRGFANLRLNRRTEAIADLRQAVALNPADEDASNALYALQNSPSSSLTPATAGWGPIARLPGRSWLLTKGKPTLTLRYAWKRVGVSMMFAGKDASGNPLEGQYFIDPMKNAIRASYLHKGKTYVSDLEIAPQAFTEIGTGPKAAQREITELQGDGSFNIVTQKMKGKAWQTVSTAVLVPTSDQMIASLGWPDAPVKTESFLHGILRSMKEGAIAGASEGTKQGITDATSYRVRQVTGTPQCRDPGGNPVKCPRPAAAQ
jgi:hypothetical protein